MESVDCVNNTYIDADLISDIVGCSRIDVINKVYDRYLNEAPYDCVRYNYDDNNVSCYVNVNCIGGLYGLE